MVSHAIRGGSCELTDVDSLAAAGVDARAGGRHEASPAHKPSCPPLSPSRSDAITAQPTSVGERTPRDRATEPCEVYADENCQSTGEEPNERPIQSLGVLPSGGRRPRAIRGDDEGQCRPRLTENTKGADWAHPGPVVLRDDTRVTITCCDSIRGGQPFIVSLRFTLEEAAKLAASVTGIQSARHQVSGESPSGLAVKSSLSSGWVTLEATLRVCEITRLK